MLSGRFTKSQLLAISVFALSIPSLAQAAITPIPEFTGEHHEGFERIYPPNAYTELPVFNSSANLHNALTPLSVICYNFFSFVTNTEVFPYNGNLFAATPVGTTVITFAEPQRAFGGFLSTVGPATDLTLTFYSPDNEILAAIDTSLPLAEWEWRGWYSDVPFNRIEIINGNFPGDALLMDDLQISTSIMVIPEPSFLLPLAALPVALLRRRR